MSGIQRPLTDQEQLKLGLITKHDTPKSPHKEHMGGARASVRRPDLPEGREELTQKITDKHGPLLDGQFDFDNVDEAGLDALLSPESASYEQGSGDLKINGVDLGSMDEDAASDIADSIDVFLEGEFSQKTKGYYGEFSMTEGEAGLLGTKPSNAQEAQELITYLAPLTNRVRRNVERWQAGKGSANNMNMERYRQELSKYYKFKSKLAYMRNKWGGQE